jgi:dihydrofolate reductase
VSRVVVIEHLTLDGVMQAPARADEDPRGGFEHGGWAVANVDAALGQAMGERTATGGGGLLLGRRTYESMAEFWPHQPDDVPYAAQINRTPKHVASRTLREPLPWPNSTLLEGDAVPAIARLRERPGGDLTVLGSGELVQALMRAGLVDELLLMIHPLVLGTGRRLFEDGGACARLELVDSRTSSTGVLIGTYRPAAAAG